MLCAVLCTEHLLLPKASKTAAEDLYCVKQDRFCSDSYADFLDCAIQADQTELHPLPVSNKNEKTSYPPVASNLVEMVPGQQGSGSA